MKTIFLLFLCILPLVSSQANIGENRIQISQRLGRALQNEGSEAVYEKGGFRIIVTYSREGISVSENVLKTSSAVDPNGIRYLDTLSTNEVDALLKSFGAGQNWQPRESRARSWKRDDEKVIALFLNRQAEKGLSFRYASGTLTQSLLFLDAIYAQSLGITERSRAAQIEQRKQEEASHIQDVFGGH